MQSAADLVAAAGRGDQGAWDALVERFAGLVWSVARAHRLDSADASDVYQTTWLRLVEHLDRLRDPERVGAWLATTARNECLRTLRRSGRSIPTADDEVLERSIDLVGASPDAALLALERDHALWQAFDELPPRCQRLLRILMSDPPPSYDEIAAVLDMPIGSIGPTRGRCLERLRAVLPRFGIQADTGGS